MIRPSQGQKLLVAPAHGVGTPCASGEPGLLWRTAEPHIQVAETQPQLLLIHSPAVTCCAGLGRKSSRAGQGPMSHLHAGFLEPQLLKKVQGSR